MCSHALPAMGKMMSPRKAWLSPDWTLTSLMASVRNLQQRDASIPAAACTHEGSAGGNSSTFSMNKLVLLLEKVQLILSGCSGLGASCNTALPAAAMYIWDSLSAKGYQNRYGQCCPATYCSVQGNTHSELKATSTVMVHRPAMAPLRERVGLFPPSSSAKRSLCVCSVKKR